MKKKDMERHKSAALKYIKMRLYNKEAFTLVEIMIVGAIIVILAAITIPNILRARINVNEARAIQAIRTIHVAKVSFRAVNPVYGELIELAQSKPPYISDFVYGGQGYWFVDVIPPFADTYLVVAIPTDIGKTGVRSFSVDQTGVIKYCDSTVGDCSPINPFVWFPIE